MDRCCSVELVAFSTVMNIQYPTERVGKQRFSEFQECIHHIGVLLLSANYRMEPDKLFGGH
jgi:hypothetical protein